MEDASAVRQIQAAASRGALSHALLFTGGGDLPAAARYAAAAMECLSPRGKPCGVCSACGKVFRDIHPDVVTVRDTAHKTISVEVIRALRADAYIRPNEGERKVYLFPDCALLTEQDQNVLLKTVEEGPPYAAFFFCAENASVLLETLRSRCVEIKTHKEAQAPPPLSQESLALCRAAGERRRGAVSQIAVGLERKKLSREDLQSLLEETQGVFSAAALALYGKNADPSQGEIVSILAKRLTKRQIMRTIEILETYRRECAYNVGPGHVLGALAAELEGIL